MWSLLFRNWLNLILLCFTFIEPRELRPRDLVFDIRRHLSCRRRPGTAAVLGRIRRSHSDTPVFNNGSRQHLRVNKGSGQPWRGKGSLMDSSNRWAVCCVCRRLALIFENLSEMELPVKSAAVGFLLPNIVEARAARLFAAPVLTLVKSLHTSLHAVPRRRDLM